MFTAHIVDCSDGSAVDMVLDEDEEAAERALLEDAAQRHALDARRRTEALERLRDQFGVQVLADIFTVLGG